MPSPEDGHSSPMCSGRKSPLLCLPEPSGGLYCLWTEAQERRATPRRPPDLGLSSKLMGGNELTTQVTETDDLRNHLETLLAELQRRSEPRERLALKCSDGSYAFLDPDEICWVDALRNYVRINLGEREYIVRQPIHELEARLDSRFVRIHRSTIVNSTKVRAVERRKHGDYVVVIDSGERLNVSRGCRSGLDAILAYGGLATLAPAS